MTKLIPQIKQYMTQAPISIAKDSLRHFLVMHKSKIEGILSSTDVTLIKTQSGVDMGKLKVNDCYTSNLYKVSPETLLDEVLDEMADKKYGRVLVGDKEHLVGILTWVDALKATKSLM